MKRRGRVQWKPEEAGRVKVARLHPYVGGARDVDLSPAEAEALTVGSLWTLRALMSVDTRYATSDYVRHEYSYLIYGGWGPTAFPAGTPAVYMGTVRVEEDNRGTPIRVLRHTFLVGGCRYMITNVPDVLQPV